MAQTKSIYELIIEEFPELLENNYEFDPVGGSISLQDDGAGAYIKKWEDSKPVPDSLKSYLQ